MSAKSESSYASSGSIRGVPLKCSCGIRVRRYTSTTSRNPGRPFYGCETMNQKNHLFKWVEDALLEEVEDLSKKWEVAGDDINQLRSNVDSLICENYDLHKDVLAIRRELRMVKIVCGGLMVVVCVGFVAISKTVKLW